jgi:2-polyprenyl-6-methoxyphenol hydroxylase-like FAD-dependent oxidoreductase
MKPLRIRIIGGSLAGLFVGILLSRDGHDVKIYERSKSGFGGRGAGLVPQREVFQLLREIGVEHLANFGVVSKDRIYFDRGGAIIERMHMPQMQISWDLLYSTVASRMGTDGYVLDRHVKNVTDDEAGSTIEFDDGSSEAAELVIGADGIGSVVRAAMNSETESRYAGYVAWRGLVPERQLRSAARVLPGDFAFYVAPGNHALGYLVPGSAGEISEGERRYNWVWYRFLDEAALPEAFTGKSGTKSRFSLARGELSVSRLDKLRNDASQLLPAPFSDAIKAEENPSVQGIFDYEAHRMVGRTTALLGDAAFVVRPHTAMGVGKAAGDALSLRDQLRSARNVSEALDRYENERIEVGREIATYGRRLAEASMR